LPEIPTCEPDTVVTPSVSLADESLKFETSEVLTVRLAYKRAIFPLASAETVNYPILFSDPSIRAFPFSVEVVTVGFDPTKVTTGEATEVLLVSTDPPPEMAST
jgi:hypothetical protein